MPVYGVTRPTVKGFGMPEVSVFLWCVVMTTEPTK